MKDIYTIEIGNNLLSKQAREETYALLIVAKEDIDKIFGDGYAKLHPELIVGYMQTVAMDIGSAIIARAIEGNYKSE